MLDQRLQRLHHRTSRQLKRTRETLTVERVRLMFLKTHCCHPGRLAKWYSQFDLGRSSS
ncbi:MAG: hypothetical protein AB3N21_05135 [Ruegeria sp.]|uniref:hypothetical protein n=1 Tax=Ruegeria sp. TaxID=1879320 RepID=UPI00349ED6C7